MKGFTFIRQTKLHDVCGRIHYISSHEEQEHLYATYETNAEPFWEDLARECQDDFKKSGAQGKCIEARELIIALPRSLRNFEHPNLLLKEFTEAFKKEYGVECSAALHHNKRMTNLHIHLIYSERTLLEDPIKKVATRNMFFDETGRKVRTKKEICDANGNIRPGTSILPKGSVYEQHMFSAKNDYFKSREFIKDVKKFYTAKMNELSRPEEKLRVFNPDGPYLATKKIGKHNPKEKEIREDNKIRDEWNKQVNVNIKYGMSPEAMKEMKQSEIIEPMNRANTAPENTRKVFGQIVLRAVDTARTCAKQFYFASPEVRKKLLTTSLKEFIARCRSPERIRKIRDERDAR